MLLIIKNPATRIFIYDLNEKYTLKNARNINKVRLDNPYN